MSDSEKEKIKMFEQFKTLMGYPHRKVEIGDESLKGVLGIAIDDYIESVQHWLIEHQWQGLLGKQVDNLDAAFALTVRDLDYMNRATYAYSKQVGLQSRGPWELKKDYIEIEAGRQVYEIPANREINEVLYMTPPTTDAALLANFGGLNMLGFTGGFSGMGMSNSGHGGMGGNGGYYIAPAFDVLLAAQDFNLKNRLLRSDLVYKITAGAEGKKLLHLISTPGSKMTFGAVGSGSGIGTIGLPGCRVWYHYYETTPENVDDCRAENPDIIMMPNDVPLNQLEFSKFNQATKIFVRQLFVAHAKKVLSKIWGKYGGIVGPPSAERTLSYEALAQEGENERVELMTKLNERLERLSTEKQYERAANEAENLNRQIKYHPLGLYVK